MATGEGRVIRLHKKLKVFPVTCSIRDGMWLNNGNIEITYDIENADIALFPGGIDISPTFYNQSPIPQCQTPNYNLDGIQMSAYSKCIENNIFVIGICRGAQLICIKNGGILIQHTSHHNLGTHGILDSKTRQYYSVNSLHHQMMWPYYLDNSDYEVLAFSKKAMFSRNQKFTYLTEGSVEFKPLGGNNFLKDETDFKEPEIIWFPKTKSFAIQFHPEMMNMNDNYLYTLKYLNGLVLPLISEHLTEKHKCKRESELLLLK